MASSTQRTIAVDDQRFVVSGEPGEAFESAIDEFTASIDREKKRRERWPGDGPQRMAALASLFPTMQGVPGTSPWDVDRLIAWMNSGAPTSGSWWAAMFLLGVWNPHTNWRDCGLKVKKGHDRFKFFEAMGAWDHQHIQAMREWIELPFWP